MDNLILKINDLKNSEISKVIKNRMDEFSSIHDENLFSELCFCLMTANFRADKCIEIQEALGEGIDNLSEKNLAEVLKSSGHRFWPQRAERIVLARKHKNELPKIRNESDRKWLVKNVKGLGMKEASHFLRNVGVKDLAIIDFHIVDLLVSEGLMGKPKSMSIGKYLEIENILKEIGKKVKLNLAELDLYLWYLETGKILK